MTKRIHIDHDERKMPQQSEDRFDDIRTFVDEYDDLPEGEHWRTPSIWPVLWVFVAVAALAVIVVGAMFWPGP